MRPNELLIFLHIPKTGGTTMRNIIEKQYHPRHIWYGYQGLPQKNQTKRIRFLSGHVSYGVHEHFQRPFSYVTMLRNPLDRIVSLYHQILADKTHYFYSKVMPINFEDFVSNDEFNLATTNQQVRFLVGRGYSTYVASEEDLNQAKRNLSHFSVAGVTERFNESLFLMMKHYRWSNLVYKKYNVRPITKKTKQNLTEEVKKIILVKNRLDFGLYDYVKQQLEQKIQQLDSQSKIQLERFIRQNSANS